MIRCACLLAVLGLSSFVFAQPKQKGVWTDPADSTLPVDFKIQGEYVGDHIGVQVIALDKGAFQAVVLPGGLPGAGWDGKIKSLMAGKLDGDVAKFTPATGKRNYLAQNPDAVFRDLQVPADRAQKTTPANADGQYLRLALPNGAMKALKKTARKSPTIGAKPPEDALVLFDGSNKDAWTGGRVDKKTKFLNTDGNDILTKKKFNNYTMHVEFMLPYRPDGRGQGRGNSGFYQVDMYEVQVLDSFGLDGKNNECGGVYRRPTRR